MNEQTATTAPRVPRQLPPFHPVRLVLGILGLIAIVGALCMVWTAFLTLGAFLGLIWGWIS